MKPCVARAFAPLLASLLLTACGMEAAGTAATVGVTKKQELEQGQAKMDKVQQQVQQSMELSKQRTEALEKAER